jgi:hypothetical protein
MRRKASAARDEGALTRARETMRQYSRPRAKSCSMWMLWGASQGPLGGSVAAGVVKSVWLKVWEVRVVLSARLALRAASSWADATR